MKDNILDPNHPSTILKEELTKSIGRNIAHCSRTLGIEKAQLTKCLAGRQHISPRMAILLEKSGIKTAIYWLDLRDNWVKQKKSYS